MVTAAREGPPEALATFALRAVPWLSPLHDAALERVLSLGRLVRFRAGQTILAELESGEEMYLLLSGTARVTVQAGPRARRQVGHLGPGDPCGEVSALTQALRSATVVADGEVLALRLERAGFEELVLNHPQIAVHFARVLAQRFADTDAALESAIEAPPAVQGPTALPESHRGLGLAWRELVVARRRELPFLALVSFTAALAVVRGAAWALQLEGRELFGFLRGAYVTGIALVFASTALSLLRFRPALQRALALFFGAGLALILERALGLPGLRHLLPGHDPARPGDALQRRGPLPPRRERPRRRHCHAAQASATSAWAQRGSSTFLSGASWPGSRDVT